MLRIKPRFSICKVCTQPFDLSLRSRNRTIFPQPMLNDYVVPVFKWDRLSSTQVPYHLFVQPKNVLFFSVYCYVFVKYFYRPFEVLFVLKASFIRRNNKSLLSVLDLVKFTNFIHPKFVLSNVSPEPILIPLGGS